MAKCLPVEYAIELKNALAKGDIDVNKLAKMTTDERRNLIEGTFKTAAQKRKDVLEKASKGTLKDKLFSGLSPAYRLDEVEEMARKFNKGFEERVITSSRNFMKKQEEVADLKKKLANKELKLTPDEVKAIEQEIVELDAKIAAHQRKLLQNYLNKQTSGIPQKARASTLDKVNNVRHMLTPDEKQVFLEDLVTAKLGFGISEEAATTIAKLADESETALRALRKSQLETTQVAVREYMKRPEVATRVKEAEVITDPSTRRNMLQPIQKEAEHFGDMVWDGTLRPDGSVVSKVFDKKEYTQLISARVEQGLKTQHLLNYVGELERALKRVDFDTLKEAPNMTKIGVANKLALQTFVDILGGSKSVVASVDFSWLFRQGWQAALTQPKMFFANMVETTENMFKVAFKAERVAKSKTKLGHTLDRVTTLQQLDNKYYDLVKAEISTRSNSLKGKYQAANNGYGLGVFQEEAFPNSFPERMPLALGRVFKMSEYGFNTMALRMRADLADTFIRQLELKGFDVMDKKLADELGLFVGALTGRGLPFGTKLLEGKPEMTNFLNATFFSPRFVGSQFYTFMAAPRWLGDMTDPVKKMAAKNTAEAVVKAAVIMGALHTTASILGTGRVDFKGDSATFGHLILGDLAFDMTGGHATVINLAGKMYNLRTGQRYDNKLGIYVDAPWTDSAVSAMVDFILNKTSPGASVVKDIVNGSGFGGEDVTFATTAQNLLVPLTIGNTIEGVQKGGWNEGVMVLLAEMLGFGVKEMRIQPMSKDWKALKAVSEKGYNEASVEMNAVLWKEVNRLRNDKQFQKLPVEEQYKEIERVSRRMKRDTVDKYRTKYKVPTN